MPGELTGTLTSTEDLLHGLVRAGDLSAAVVVASGASGELLTCAAGWTAGGKPACRDAPVFSFCATKPIVACALLSDCERRGLDPRRVHLRPADLGLEGADGGAAYPLPELLAHLSGLRDPLIMDVLAGPPESLERLMIAGIAASAQQEPAQFSEVGAWELMLRFLSQNRGTSPVEVVNRIFADAGMTHSGVRPHLTEAVASSMLVPVWDSEDRPVPMYLTASSQVAQRMHPCVGSYVTTVDMHHWWRQFGQVLAGAADPTPGLYPSRSVVDHVVAAATGVSSDRSLGTVAPYAAGSMVQLASHGWSPGWSSASVGHHGGGASLLGWCDPVSGRAVSVFSGRFWLDPKQRNAYIGDLTQAVSSDLDAAEAV